MHTESTVELWLAYQEYFIQNCPQYKLDCTKPDIRNLGEEISPLISRKVPAS